MRADRFLYELSTRQGGAIRLDQAIDAGLTRHQIRYRIRSGLWERLVRGAYLLRRMQSVDDRLRAAVAALPEAVVSHEAAAEVHGLSYVARGLATVLVHSQTTHEFPGVSVRRCHDLSADHVERVNGLPTTSVARTIVDLAALVSERNLAAIIDDAVTAKLVTIEAVCAVAEAIGRSGKPGTKNLRGILEERSGPGMRGTGLERRGNALLSTIEGATPRFEFAVPWCPDKRFDAAYPEARLAIEWDGRRWHTQEAAFQRDRTRDREATLHGWRMLRFTWDDVTERPNDVIGAVRAALGR